MGRMREFDVDRAVGRAMDLFWRRGYAETSLQDLLDELSIGSGSFYAAFGSKGRLYLRALDRYSALQADDLVEILERATEIRPAVRQVLVAMIEADLADPSRGCLVVNTATEGGTGLPAAELSRRCGTSSRRSRRPWSARSRGVSCPRTRPRSSWPAS
ncbi:TetR/AcrR family transcriptional regulator [Actinacidiphila sp. bgisy160]|uniref:TetR/AcrR family transcriptional regulator n=1 Tax=Actinacidiphila sp. bgisy160 TaxID=3413796 RepID=UPI003D740B14